MLRVCICRVSVCTAWEDSPVEGFHPVGPGGGGPGGGGRQAVCSPGHLL